MNDHYARNVLSLQDFEFARLREGLIECVSAPQPFDLHLAVHFLFAYKVNRYCHIPRHLMPHVGQEVRTGLVIFDLKGETMGSGGRPWQKDRPLYNAHGVRINEIGAEVCTTWTEEEAPYERQIIVIGIGSGSDAVTVEMTLARLGIKTPPNNCAMHSVRRGDKRGLVSVLERYLS